MTDLERIAKEATDHGMTYGEYVAWKAKSALEEQKNYRRARQQARPQNLDITPSIVASVTVRLRGKHYRVVRNAGTMLRASMKSKKRAPRREQGKIFNAH